MGCSKWTEDVVLPLGITTGDLLARGKDSNIANIDRYSREVVADHRIATGLDNDVWVRNIMEGEAEMANTRGFAGISFGNQSVDDVDKLDVCSPNIVPPVSGCNLTL